ncbi:membrane protein, partial [Rhodopirellula maiorica SM1]
MTFAYYIFVFFAAMVAYGDFRRGIYLAIILDLLRDLVRKADPTQSVLITLAGAAVWGAVFLGATRAYPALIQRAF